MTEFTLTKYLLISFTLSKYLQRLFLGWSIVWGALEPCRTSSIKLIFAKIVKCWKVVNYFQEIISSEIFECVLNTFPIFKLLRENISKFVSLGRLNHSSRGICSLCTIYKSSLKVNFFLAISFFLNLWTRKCSSVICIIMSLSVFLRGLWIK